MENGADWARSCELAQACYKSGDYEQARHYFQAALALSNPQDERTASVYREYTLFLHKTGECAEALSMVKQGLAQFPDCRELYNFQGQIYYELGWLEQSRINFLKCIALKASYNERIDDENLAEHRPYFFLTAITALQGKSEDMLHYLRLFVEKNPPFPALQKLFWLLLHLGSEARIIIDNLSTVYGVSSPFLSNLLLMVEEYEAKVLLGKTLTPGEADPQAYCMLGLLCSRLGIYDEAMEYLLHAMALDQENQIYPCLVFEVLAVQSVKILLQWSDSFQEIPAFINELLRLCAIKRKAKLIRQQIAAQGIDLKQLGGINIHCSILSPVDDVDEEDVWQINV